MLTQEIRKLPPAIVQKFEFSAYSHFIVTKAERDVLVNQAIDKSQRQGQSEGFEALLNTAEAAANCFPTIKGSPVPFLTSSGTFFLSSSRAAPPGVGWARQKGSKLPRGLLASPGGLEVFMEIPQSTRKPGGQLKRFFNPNRSLIANST